MHIVYACKFMHACTQDFDNKCPNTVQTLKINIKREQLQNAD